ncbi:unnamed protein product, partial [Owenia fusiformis]
VNHFDVIIPAVQKQNNGYDCGLFSIAFMTEFCFNGFNRTSRVVFEEKEMRSHLVSCLTEKKIIPFPKQTKKKLKLSKVATSTFQVSCFCPCGQADVVQDMVGCEFVSKKHECQTWYHKKCSKLKKVSKKMYCPDH